MIVGVSPQQIRKRVSSFYVYMISFLPGKNLGTSTTPAGYSSRAAQSPVHTSFYCGNT